MGEDGEQNQAEKGSELLPLNPSASDPIQYLHDVLYVVESDFCMWRAPCLLCNDYEERRYALGLAFDGPRVRKLLRNRNRGRYTATRVVPHGWDSQEYSADES